MKGGPTRERRNGRIGGFEWTMPDRLPRSKGKSFNTVGLLISALPWLCFSSFIILGFVFLGNGWRGQPRTSLAIPSVVYSDLKAHLPAEPLSEESETRAGSETNAITEDEVSGNSALMEARKETDGSSFTSGGEGESSGGSGGSEERTRFNGYGELGSKHQAGLHSGYTDVVSHSRFRGRFEDRLNGNAERNQEGETPVLPQTTGQEKQREDYFGGSFSPRNVQREPWRRVEPPSVDEARGRDISRADAGIGEILERQEQQTLSQQGEAQGAELGREWKQVGGEGRFHAEHANVAGVDGERGVGEETMRGDAGVFERKEASAGISGHLRDTQESEFSHGSEERMVEKNGDAAELGSFQSESGSLSTERMEVDGRNHEIGGDARVEVRIPVQEAMSETRMDKTPLQVDGAQSLDEIWSKLIHKQGGKAEHRRYGSEGLVENVDSLEQIWKKHYAEDTVGGQRLGSGTSAKKAKVDLDALWDKHFSDSKKEATGERQNEEYGSLGGGEWVRAGRASEGIEGEEATGARGTGNAGAEEGEKREEFPMGERGFRKREGMEPGGGVEGKGLGEERGGFTEVLPRTSLRREKDFKERSGFRRSDIRGQDSREGDGSDSRTGFVSKRAAEEDRFVKGGELADSRRDSEEDDEEDEEGDEERVGMKSEGIGRSPKEEPVKQERQHRRGFQSHHWEGARERTQVERETRLGGQWSRGATEKSTEIRGWERPYTRKERQP